MLATVNNIDSRILDLQSKFNIFFEMNFNFNQSSMMKNTLNIWFWKWELMVSTIEDGDTLLIFIRLLHNESKLSQLK